MRSKYTVNISYIQYLCRPQWPRGIRRGSATASLLGMRVEFLRGHGCLSVVSVLCVFCQVEDSASG